MRKQNGFTLIEILVTVVVLAIGLLGLAGLQAISLRYNSTAYQRSQATILAYDIVERMRASKPAGGIIRCPQQDVPAWLAVVAATLPLGTGSVAPSGNVCVITVQWDDDRDGVLDPPFVVNTEL
ncbi:MAG: type IV pilus modification protein PilV [Gammaproteobacteria bacterium]|nr:type IV pilus modification protein PilV [Gammaproteobacteria bacterium]